MQLQGKGKTQVDTHLELVLDPNKYPTKSFLTQC